MTGITDHDQARKLIFVYNAKSGWANKFLDGLHKAVSPRTYQCNLCNVTFGLIGERSKWRRFRQHSHTAMEFYYADEFMKQMASKFGHKFTFPIVLLSQGDQLEVLVRTDELNAIRSADELIDLLSRRMSGLT